MEVTGGLTALPAAPGPGSTFTVPGSENLPSEQQTTEAAVNYGWLIAIILIAAVVIGVVRYVTRRIDLKLLLGLAFVGFVAYQVGKGN